MSHYFFQSTNFTIKKNNELSEFAVLCSFIRSHPIYFSYLIFFSPYLLKLLYFLSPLFITISLFFFSLLTTLIPFRSVVNPKEGFFLTAYTTLLEKLRPKFDNEGEKAHPIEGFNVYNIVFETPIFEVMENNPEENEKCEENPNENEKFEENPDENEKCEENPFVFSEENVPQEERVTGDQCLETGDAKPNKVKEEVKKYESFLNRNGSEVNKTPINEGIKPRVGSLRLGDEKKLSEAFSQTVGSPPYLGSFGSMRKEIEWRRTLACKLFEERNNWSINSDGVDGGVSEQGMDLLWETYETESNRAKPKEESKKGRRRERIEDLMVMNDDDDYDFDGDDHDNGKICCLQALKLSAGKMNLSMGKPNLIKIGKAFKGIGWFQSHVRRQGKKGSK